MAYATTNPPALMVPRLGGGVAFWHYNSADAATVVRVTGYISDGAALGMKVGDLVFQTDLAAGAVGHVYMVKSVTAGGSADLSDGTAIVATDTD
jgi:hypothetical protein